MSGTILIILGIILLVLGLLGIIRLRSTKWAVMPLWHAVVELIIGIIILVIGFM
ncbi:MAG: hypothetical protein ACYCXK_01530 [Candidatus Humimicrobiaceae bacterium]